MRNNKKGFFRLIGLIILGIIIFLVIKNVFNKNPLPSCGDDICTSDESALTCTKDCASLFAPYHPEKYTFTKFQNKDRSYWLYAPSCNNGKKALPLVFSFHGALGTADTAEISVGSMNKKAESECFLAVYPNGTSLVDEPGRRQIWNSNTEGPDIRLPEVDDVGFVNKIISEISAKYPVDQNRIYLSGLSNGARISYRLACELSDKIAAIAVVGAGMQVKDCAPKSPISVLHFHGSKDPSWPVAGGPSCLLDFSVEPISKTIDKWKNFISAGINPTSSFTKGQVKCDIYSGAKNSEVEFCLVGGAGHTWPGGYSFPSEALTPWKSGCYLGRGHGTGEVNTDISALDMMWNFFEKHPKVR